MKNDILNELETARRQIILNMEKEKVLSKYSMPAKPGKDGYFRVMIKDGTKKSGRSTVAAKSLDELTDKLILRDRTGESFAEIYQLTKQEKLKYIKNPQKLYSVQNTIKRNDSTINMYFIDTEFYTSCVRTLTKHDIEEFIFQILSDKNLTKKALATIKTILKLVFDYAYFNEIIFDNPLTRVDFKKFNDMLVEPKPVSQRYHSDNDISRMLKCIHIDQHSRPDFVTPYAMELQILTGMRRGEIPPLTWDDISLERIYIHREQITVRRFNDIPEHFEIVDHTKTHKDRYFPVTTEIQLYLDKLAAMHIKYYKKSSFLFPADRPTGCITNNMVYSYYRNICAKLGIEVNREFQKGTHAFRRTHITQFVNKSGGNILMASALYGNSVEVAQRHYYTGVDLNNARMILEQ